MPNDEYSLKEIIESFRKDVTDRFDVIELGYDKRISFLEKFIWAIGGGLAVMCYLVLPIIINSVQIKQSNQTASAYEGK